MGAMGVMGLAREVAGGIAEGIAEALDGRFVRRLLPGVGLGVAWLVLASAPAGAEMYACPGPDGKTLYTSNASLCPGAAVHVPKGHVVHTHDTAAPAVSAARPAPADDAALAAPWKEKRRQAEQRLQKVDGLLANYHQAEGLCNRGDALYLEDEDGIRHQYACSDVKAKEEKLAAEKAKLQAYLAEGLADECRKAGCEPGWIR
jgi:hypothetical protein